MSDEEAIQKLKEKYPEYKDIEFQIDYGELSYCVRDTSNMPNMNLMQKEINKILGQKVYKAEYVTYREVYATNENEAREILKFLDKRNPSKVFEDVMANYF